MGNKQWSRLNSKQLGRLELHVKNAKYHFGEMFGVFLFDIHICLLASHNAVGQRFTYTSERFFRLTISTNQSTPFKSSTVLPERPHLIGWEQRQRNKM